VAAAGRAAADASVVAACAGDAGLGGGTAYAPAESCGATAACRAPAGAAASRATSSCGPAAGSTVSFPGCTQASAKENRRGQKTYRGPTTSEGWLHGGVDARSPSIVKPARGPGSALACWSPRTPNSQLRHGGRGISAGSARMGLVMPHAVEQFFSPLAAVVPAQVVDLRGEWSTSLRRSYANATQADSGEGPFVEAVDAQWFGAFEAPVPLAGIAMLYRSGRGHWAKSNRAATNPEVRLSLTARADYMPARASFQGTLHGAVPPSFPVPCGKDLPAGCTLGSSRANTGRVHLVAETAGALFMVVLLQNSVLKNGRNHLWRLRDELAAGLPSDLRALLTRGRTGQLDIEAE
jgi:hypothetical protein